MSSKLTTHPPSGENAFPLVLRGRPIQQLPLPRTILVKNERRVGSLNAIKPSNLAEVRAKLAAR